MSRDTAGQRELDYVQALLRRGFVNIPRILFDYTADLALDYDTIGKLFAVMAAVGGRAEEAFGPYAVSKKAGSGDFELMHRLIEDLKAHDLVDSEETTDQILFTFQPLHFRLRAIHEHYRQQQEEEVAAGIHPAVRTAERLLVNLNDRQVADVLDWVENYNFGPEMVEAVIREGQRQGITRMAYLNKIARQWHEEGVTTPAEAEESAQRHRRAMAKHRAVLQYLGLDRPVSMAEQAMLDKWSEEWGFSNEMIIRACAAAVGKNNQFQYVNRVLESWRERGIKSLADVERDLTEYKQRRAGAPSATRSRKPASTSNVLLRRDKKDEDYYDHIYKRFDK